MNESLADEGHLSDIGAGRRCHGCGLGDSSYVTGDESIQVSAREQNIDTNIQIFEKILSLVILDTLETETLRAFNAAWECHFPMLKYVYHCLP